MAEEKTTTVKRELIGTGWLICKSEVAAKRVCSEIGIRKAKAKEIDTRFPIQVKRQKDTVFFDYYGNFDYDVFYDFLTKVQEEFMTGTFHIISGADECQLPTTEVAGL